MRCTKRYDCYTNSEHPAIKAGYLAPGIPSLSTTASYLKPKTLDEAMTLLASGPARILSGGTDFYPALGDRVVRDKVVDISGLGILRGVSTEAEYIRIGGLTTWTEIIRTPLPRCFDALKSAAREVGSVQIQNRGTVAGNLCNASPAADGVPPLLVLDAEVELTSRSHLRQMPLAEFIVGNRKTLRQRDELLTAVLVPRKLENTASVFMKLGARRYLVISISMVAVVLRLSPRPPDEDKDEDKKEHRRVLSARVAVGSCSAVAQRLPKLEQDLVGSPVSDDLATMVRPEHLADLTPIDDVRATADYRLEASLRLVQRALNRCAASDHASDNK